jgi:hypothetical protein
MVRRILIAILSLAAAGAVVADAYRWVDENGVVQYSDRPHPGAERIILSASPAQPPRPRVANTVRPQEADPVAEAEPETANYESIDIASPGPEETLWNLGGTLNVTVNLQPGLQEGDQLRVHLDGAPQIVSGTSFAIPEIYRGVHNIQVEVIDQAGQLRIRSANNRFYVQQTSIN